MSEVIATSENGRYRLTLEQDMYPESPDYDGQGYVFALDYRFTGPTVVECLSEPTGDPWTPEIADALSSAVNRWDLESDNTRRYLAMFHDVVSMDTYHQRSGGQFVMLVTNAMCDEWGVPVGAPYRRETADLHDWKALDEGDVYAYAIEELVMWHADGREDEERWETLDSCAGFYGYDYARESALEAFSYVGVTA